MEDDLLFWYYIYCDLWLNVIQVLELVFFFVEGIVEECVEVGKVVVDG